MTLWGECPFDGFLGGAMNRVFLTGLTVGVLAFGCGLDDNWTGLGNGAIPGDPLYTAPESASCACDMSAEMGPDLAIVPELTGTLWRFDFMCLSSPLPQATLEMVNPVVRDQFEKDLITVLLACDLDDRAGGQLNFRLGPGLAQGSDYVFEGDGAVTAGAWDGETGKFTTSDPVPLAIAIDLGAEPLVLPIRDIQLVGVVSSDGGAIEAGSLMGALSLADAQELLLAGKSLADYIQESDPPVALDVDLDQDGDPDAWNFGGCFTAVAVTAG